MTVSAALKDQFLKHFTTSEAALRGFIASVIFIPSDRDDILQEVALRLWQLYHRYDPARPFTPWALGVASLRMKEECRKVSRRPVLLDESHLERMTSAFSSMAEQETAHPETALSECLDALPPEAAGLIRDRYFSGRSIGELSKSHGLTPPAVYQTLCRLRRRLAACIRARMAHENATSTSINHVP